MLESKPKWVALYSQTGSELRDICANLKRHPDIILCNNRESASYQSHEDIESYLLNLKPGIVTLHGYLKILSPEVCARHRIINGHPGPIHRYSDLKGKDPQIRWFMNQSNYSVMGTVIHEVIPEVDEGKIISYMESTGFPENLNDTISQLKTMSVMLWINLLKEIL